MQTFRCASCGREIKPAVICPHCGAQQPQWTEHLAEIERSIAEMKARDAEIAREQRQIAAKMQAALFQRDILAHAGEERTKRTTRPRRVLRRRPGRRPPTAATGAPPRVPRQGTPPPGPDDLPPPSRTRPQWLDVDDPEHPPEASSREVQNIPLGLGALLLGVAAVVFAAVATSSMDALARLGVLLVATVLMLLGPPVLARRGLTSTAETIAAVGLLLLPLAGYALWAVDRIGGAASGSAFAGSIFLVTTVVSVGYAYLTGLRAPRFATVLAAQPVLPLLTYERITGPAGWALVLTVVAVVDLALARSAVVVERPVRRDLPTPPAAPAPPRQRAADERPEAAPEESAEVLGAEPIGGEPAVPPARPVPWLRELTWSLHGLAVAVALAYAVTALLRAETVPAATGAGTALLLAALVGLAGTLVLRRPPLPDVGAGIVTLAVIGALGRVASVAFPGRSLLLIAAVIALTGFAVRAVPEGARRGPQLASAVALTVSGLVVAGGALRAGLAPVRASLPAWSAELSRWPGELAAAVGPTGWQLAASALLLTIAAVIALPPDIRREFAVVGAALTALAVPASLGLGWAAACWPMLLTAVGIGVLGLTAGTRRAAVVHAVTAAGLGLLGAGAALARPALSAAALTLLFLAGALVSLAPRVRIAAAAADTLSGWAAGGAAFALPGAVAAFVAATEPAAPVRTPANLREVTVPILAASFLGVCVTLGHAAVVQVAQRRLSAPHAVGTVLGAVGVAAAAFGAPGATAADAWVGGLLLLAAALLALAPRIDAGRRSDLSLDGSDLALAATTTALIATLVRIAAVLTPGGQLVVAAALVLVVAGAARAMPEEWRRGPILGIALAGTLVGLIAGWSALRGGFGVLATPGPIWAGDLSGWPAAPVGGATWQAPVALALLAVAAGILLPPPWRYDVAGVAAVLATIGAPAAFGLPWWSPVLVGAMVATVFGTAAVAAVDPRAALSRATVAGVVALHAAGAGLVRPWTTALALGSIALIGVVVAALARTLAPSIVEDVRTEGMPTHLVQVGGAATGAALLALPGAVAALAAEFGRSPQVVLTAALAASSIGLAAVAAARRQVPQYLPYASVAVVGGGTISAIAAVLTHLPSGVYAAAAALLGVLAELIRAATTPPVGSARPVRRWSVLLDGALRRWPDDGSELRWRVNPAAGALAAAVLPVALALVTLAPPLLAALAEPMRVLSRVWQGPPPELRTPPPEAVDPTHVLTALLLTVTAALAATGFSGGRRSRAVPVVLPGAAVTLLITPVALGHGWPASALAGLAVFTLAMLGLALTPPPPLVEPARSIRVTRVLVFAIGLAAGGAGLAGSLATRQLTLFTLGGAVGVGVVAALFGTTQRARILGWLFASLMAELFVLTLGLVAGLAAVWSAFGVLAVGAALQVFAATLPRLRRPEAYRESATVEWSGYAAALIALALAYDSPRHIAALLAAWGAVLGVAASRPGRRPVERRILFWSVVACEISAWWILMRVADVALPEAYTLPFATLALLVGVLELRHRPDLSSWVAYGPALVAAFLPTLAIVVATDSSMLRQVLLLLGAVAVLIFGSMTRQQAPVIVGATVTAVAAVHALFALGPWLVLIPVGFVLLVLGASNERRRRAQERLQTALRGMR
ncbi:MULTISPECIES: SCO7613 C-terminal domain-containing membrane protein [Micromonospora]|uniref:Permease n=1 Tax=Micromonospora solifontis TaxID=2487138 RepID=A0ABX9WCE0_9ACTN|nr:MULTISPECIES: permease [Micromonospora]NES16930.1 permease [Micromonospora sp. PPF5-17B]NES38260.1 permease [Micromonospora solifontis]NES58634.1 permease [Micromonospora sp. PPF5-6]RNL96379.1 permease [Micromonospora solifontis]